MCTRSIARRFQKFEIFIVYTDYNCSFAIKKLLVLRKEGEENSQKGALCAHEIASAASTKISTIFKATCDWSDLCFDLKFIL